MLPRRPSAAAFKQIEGRGHECLPTQPTGMRKNQRPTRRRKNEDGHGAAKALAASVPSWFAALIGLVLLTVFVIALHSLWQHASETQSQATWDRRIYLYQGVFSLVSAVVGAVFGVSVYRPRLKQAENKADQSRRKRRMRRRKPRRPRAGWRPRLRRSARGSCRPAAESSRSQPQISVPTEELSRNPRLARSFLQRAMSTQAAVNVVDAKQLDQAVRKRPR